MSTSNPLARVGQAVLRIVSGFLFFFPGALKILGWFGGMPAGFALTPLLRTAGWMEMIGGPLVMIGLFTRPVAFLLSGDYPRSRILTAVLLVIFVGLAVAPFAFTGAAAINTAAKICIFIVLVASYDLLLGYTGIVSFAHAMCFGIGGYGVGLTLYSFDATWLAILLGLAIALVVGIVLALLIGLLSLRVKAIFLPSGDQAGNISVEVVFVSRLLPVPSRLIV